MHFIDTHLAPCIYISQNTNKTCYINQLSANKQPASYRIDCSNLQTSSNIDVRNAPNRCFTLLTLDLFCFLDV